LSLIYNNDDDEDGNAGRTSAFSSSSKFIPPEVPISMILLEDTIKSCLEMLHKASDDVEGPGDIRFFGFFPISFSLQSFQYPISVFKWRLSFCRLISILSYVTPFVPNYDDDGDGDGDGDDAQDDGELITTKCTLSD
jgi:hypothetical protein